MSRSHRLTDEEIIAAQLRIVLDEKLGRTTPELVTRIANALPGDPVVLTGEPADAEPPSPEASGSFIDITFPGEESAWSVVQVETQHDADSTSGRPDPVIRAFNVARSEAASRLPSQQIAQGPRPVLGQSPQVPRSAGNYPVNTPMAQRMSDRELKRTLKNAAEELEKAAEKIGNAEEGPGSE